jgi:hypothetical protein
MALKDGRIGLVLGLCLAASATPAHASSNNFPLASAPVPYPTFELNGLDSKLSASFQRVTDGTVLQAHNKVPGYSSNGVGLDFIIPEPYVSLGALIHVVALRRPEIQALS